MRKESGKSGMGRWEDFSLQDNDWVMDIWPIVKMTKGRQPRGGVTKGESPGWSKMKAELGVRACQRHWLITKTGLCFSHLKQQGMVKGGGHKNPVTGEDNRRHWFFGCCWFAFLSFVLLSMGFVFIWRRQRKTLQNYFELNNDVKIHKAGFEQQHSDRELRHLPALKSKQLYS